MKNEQDEINSNKKSLMYFFKNYFINFSYKIYLIFVNKVH